MSDEDEEPSISYLKNKRKYMRGELIKIHTNIEVELSTLSVEVKTKLQTRLEKLRSDFESINDKIFSALFSIKASEESTQAEYDACAEYDSVLSTCLTKLRAAVPRDARPDGSENNRSTLKLPHVPLPEYGHREGEDLHKFLLNFENVIDKYRLSSYEKFVYLQRQLSNEPLTIIKSLELGRQNYESAKELLQKAFASPVTQQYRLLKQLSELKMGNNDDPYTFISQMRMISESFETLQISTDTVLQYFFWNAMNGTLQQQFIHITNTSKPNYQQIKEFTFDAAERYMTTRKTKSNRDSAWVSAATVNPGGTDVKPKNKYCTWCTGKGVTINSHSSFECRKYSTAEEKQTRLKSLNGCIKCGNLQHTTKDCKFNFKRKCPQCDQLHFGYLCTHKNKNEGAKKEFNKKMSSKEKTDTVKESSSVQSGSVYIGKVNVQHYGEDVIIPTFTLQHSSGHLLRGMRDSGCQPNLITQSCADKLKLKTVSNEFPLNINGFNASIKHDVKIVELKIDPKKSPIKAICVPSINMKLKLPGLSEIARHFQKKGYKLADQALLNSDDEISDLNLVLGNIDANLIPQTEVLFGSQNCSVYSDTPIGIMLLGGVQRLRRNLEELPDLATEACKIFSCGVESDFGINPSSAEDITYHPSYDDHGEINADVLEAAAESILKRTYFSSHQYVTPTNDTVDESEARLSEYVLNNIKQTDDGRLVMPLLWREDVSHLLASNLNLSKQVLKSNLKRLQRNPELLQMYDEVIREQIELGIVEKIPDLQQFLIENPTASFLPHMGVFKLNNETTKCRIVFLSNLAENKSNQNNSISHNQAMLSGPNLNRKITTALLKLRFDKYLMCFDLQKAFLTIAVPPVDQSRLMFLWFMNTAKEDFSIVAFKTLRLPFGLRCSPALLMLGLYKILILDARSDTENIKTKKKLIYDLLYMDNGCVTTNSLEELKTMETLLEQTFAPYQFRLQKFFTNDPRLQKNIDSKGQEKTPEQIKLLGLKYNRVTDTISTAALQLDSSANTRRKVLASLAGNFDVFLFAGPILNRARLFVHQLQCDQNLGWDNPLSEPRVREWKCIAKQVNGSVPIDIKRFVGNRDDEYRLIAFTDASKMMIGSVIYIQNLKTKNVNFLLAKNRIVGKQLETKSVPALELQAVTLGVDSLIDTTRELTGDRSVVPIKITELHLYSDSMVTLNWIDKHVNRLGKMQKCSVFVKNRLETINRQCSSFPITFRFISGLENPADLITRTMSHKQLIKSNFHTGPQFLKDVDLYVEGEMCFQVPNPLARRTSSVHENPVTLAAQPITTKISTKTNSNQLRISELISLQRYQSFQKLVRIFQYVLKFVKKLKLKAKIIVPFDVQTNLDLFTIARNCIIRHEQEKHLPEVYKYFDEKFPAKLIPNMIDQLNVFRDETGILRVRSKFREWSNSNAFPILIPRNSVVTQMIVNDFHQRMAHAGCFAILAQLRKHFYIPKAFVTVKSILSECVICKKQNARTVKLNQACYRDFRVNPTNIPYCDIFIDHFGPFLVNKDDKKIKVWVLCITCLWSRAINLKVCYDMTVSEFLRTLQLHVFEYGLPERVFSDMGTQLIAGANIIIDYLKDASTQMYFAENNVKTPTFDQFYKGHKPLGSLVETCVKISKKALYGAIGHNVLPHLQFELIIPQTVNLVNKRPIAFKEYLRASSTNETEVPVPITPELLIKGYESNSVSIIPAVCNDGEDWTPTVSPTDKIRENYSKLSKVREKLIDTYRDEFLSTLMHQACDQKDRYRPVLHRKLQVDDVVLIKEDNRKRVNFPLGIVQKVISNSLGEVTTVEVKKGKSGEILKRHVSSLIPLFSNTSKPMLKVDKQGATMQPKIVNKRIAALRSTDRTKELCDTGLV